MANSQAVAQVSIFDQDLLNPGLGNLVQRIAATVTLAVPNALIYSGYLSVNNTSFTNLLPAGAACAFAYARNATLGNVTNNPLVLEIQQTGSGIVSALNLFSGGIFLFCNQFLTGTPAIPGTLQTFGYASFIAAPTVMEYLIAY